MHNGSHMSVLLAYMCTSLFLQYSVLWP